jgi:hypothetical protein
MAPPADPPAPDTADALEPMRRLSRAQLQAALEELARRALPQSGAAIAGHVGPALDASSYPPDSYKNLDGGRHGGLLRTDQVVQQAHVEGGYGAALALAAELTDGKARLGELLGACATDADAGNDAACLRDFVKRFGRWVVRRPLDDAEVAFYASVVDGSPVDAANVANVLALLLTSPDFVYVVERGTPTDVPGRSKLTAHEVATRLALHFWDTIPDAELDALADSGRLLDRAIYAQQVARLAADARTDAVVRSFFAEWFQLEDTPELHTRLGDPTYRALAGAFTPTADTREHAIDEVKDLAAYLLRHDGKLADVLTDDRAFARAADVASLYGVPAWDGTSTPKAMPGRNLLSRVALLATGMTLTRPVMKGVRIRTGLLCQTLPPPPPAAMNAVVELAPDLTTREVLERLTEAPGSSCAACHKPLINPLGYVTEGFDSFGRARTAQQLFDASGKSLGSKPIKTDAVVHVTSGDERPAADATQTAGFILESGELERCFAQQYFRFAFGRREARQDRNVLEQLAYSAFKGEPIVQVLQAIALRPEFQLRMSR